MPLYNLDIPLRRQVIILHGKYFTEFDRPYSWKLAEDRGWHTTWPRAWLCPRCLTVWAKIYEPNRPDEPFSICIEPCARHGGDESLLKMMPVDLEDPGLLDFGTEEFVKREFAIALSTFERTQSA